MGTDFIGTKGTVRNREVSVRRGSTVSPPIPLLRKITSEQGHQGLPKYSKI